MIIGVLAAGVAGLLVYYLSTTTAAQASAPPPTPLPTATPLPAQVVVLAARDLAARTVITAQDVVTREFPVGLVPADAIGQVSDVLSQTAMTPVFAGEVLLKRQFVAANGLTGASTLIPAGKVLVAFPATDMLNATGAVQAGDKVDILISLPVSGTTALNADLPEQEAGGRKSLVTQATMQNVQVYSTGVWSPNGTTADAGVKVITFIVDRQEALILKYIKDSGGTIDLAVRSAADDKPAPTDPVSLDYLVDLYHLVNGPSQ
jgi:pilus assembly protein CpaB